MATIVNGRRRENLRSQLGDCNATTTLNQPVAILPASISELRAPHNDLAQGNAGFGPDGLNLHVYPCIEAKDKAIVLSIQNEVPTGDEDLARRGHSLGLEGGIIGHWEISRMDSS